MPDEMARDRDARSQARWIPGEQLPILDRAWSSVEPLNWPDSMVIGGRLGTVMNATGRRSPFRHCSRCCPYAPYADGRLRC